MFASIYGRNKAHIANVKISNYSINKKVFELDISSFEGHCDVDVTNGLIFVFKDNSGNKIYNGFMKSIIQDEKTGYVAFKGDDFRRIFDTEILLDFSRGVFESQSTNYRLDFLFEYVTEEIGRQDSSLFTLNFIISNDATITTIIALFDGSYFYINALTFLKTYLAYYNYYITGIFNEVTNIINFEFVKNIKIYHMRLKDFVFEKASTDIKINHTTARIKFETSRAGQLAWVSSTEAYWDAQAPENRDLLTSGSVFSYGDATLKPEGFALKITNTTTAGVTRYTKDYYVALPANNVWVKSWKPFFEATAIANKTTITPNPGTDELYPSIQMPNIITDDYLPGFGVKIDIVIEGYQETYDSYWVCYPYSFRLPTTTVKKNYYLGLDNNVYEETIVAANQIYPVITKIFESEYLSKAQFAAVWELVNSRFNEHIILTKTISPININDFILYDMITVYDKNGVSKVLPVSEIIITSKKYSVKLGFKKIKFTEIVKEATGTTSSGYITKSKVIDKKNKYQVIQ